MTFPDTDPVPEPSNQPQYGFLARVIGLPILEERLLDAIEQLVGTSDADKQALAQSLAKLRSADATVDAIEPGQTFDVTDQTNAGPSKKKGTKP